MSHAGSELRRGRDAVRVLKCMRGNGGTTTLRFNKGVWVLFCVVFMESHDFLVALVYWGY